MTTTDELGALFEQLDRGALPAAWRLVGIDVDSFRTSLRKRGFSFVDPERGPAAASAVEGTADRFVTRARRRATVVGAAAGNRPSVLSVLVVRLAWRLAIVYGTDPRTEAGRRATWMAVCTALDVDLGPDPIAARLHDLPQRSTAIAHRRSFPGLATLSGITQLRNGITDAATTLRVALRPQEWTAVIDVPTR